MAETLTRTGERLAAPPPSAVRRLRHAVGGFLYRVPAARLALLLGPILLWMVVIYLGSLGLLFITSFWRQDSVTGAIVQNWGLTNYRFLVQEEVYRTIAIRTVGIALAVYAALERIPNSLIEASTDLGARWRTTFRRVILPIAFPGIVAGSIFAFSLTLGDYIAPNLVGDTEFIGNVIYQNVGIANNIPFAAAYAIVPALVMGAYLLIARQLKAFEAL
jgi:ABC-type spermidine/putrescine transport system permease subunit I